MRKLLRYNGGAGLKRLRKGFFSVMESVMGKEKKDQYAYLTDHQKLDYIITIRDLKPVDA